jgi:hypothetical protein
MIPIPVCFLPEMLAGKSEKDHGPPAYFNKLRFVVKDLKILKICGQKICGRSFVVRSFVVRRDWNFARTGKPAATFLKEWSSESSAQHERIFTFEEPPVRRDDS